MSDVRGFSLVETLAALAVLSFGALGMLALFAEMLSELRGARLQNEAVEMAADWAGRLYGNAAGSEAPSGPFAADDLADWRMRIARSLPGGDVEISAQALGGVSRQTLEISWDDAGRGRRNHRLSLIVGAQP